MKRVLFIMAIAAMVCGMCSCKSKQFIEPDMGLISPDIANTRSSEEVVVNTNLVNKYWKLIELMGKEVTYSEDALKEAYISFKEDGKVNGNAGCNSFSGTYILQNGNRIQFSQMISTKMLCLDMSIEDAFFQILKQADSYYVQSDKLVLNRARMAPLARFEAVYMK
jgi:heat shock protein HslJ